MTAGTTGGPTTGWQFILADLALILFLITLTALPGDAGVARDEGGAGSARAHTPQPAIAPAQALYRPVPGGQGLARWLANQPQDPRATVTVFARHAPGGERAAWQAAEALAREAAGSGHAVRTIIAAGEEADLYVSLAYDAPRAHPP